MTKFRNNYTHDNCPFCRSSHISKAGDVNYQRPLFFSSTEIKIDVVPELWVCSTCSSAFIQNAIHEQHAVQLYSQSNSAHRWSVCPFAERKPEEQLAVLSQCFGVGKSVLDIGCNTGELLDFAKSLGVETAGVEYSRASCNVLAAKGHGTYSSIREVDRKFDVITAFDLIEHLYDVSSFLERCKGILSKGGALVLLTGDIGSTSARLSKHNWWYIRYPEHIVFPSKKFFSEFAGFAVDRIVPTYASTGYKRHWWDVLKGVASGLLGGTYNGLPAIGSDHMLVVLKNED